MDYDKPTDPDCDNETAARDCSVACLCNVKLEHDQGAEDEPGEHHTVDPWAVDPWEPCDCVACSRRECPVWLPRVVDGGAS